MQSNDTNNDDDGTSDDVTDKFDNPFGTFSKFLALGW